MRCASCGGRNDVDARFCSACGHALVARGDERRVVTVLFADLVGFTHLSETRDPEQVKNLVDRCFERLAQDITAFGGRIDKVIGDALLALFGAPVAHEDDAERAVRAALRMQHTLRTYVDEAGAEIRMRVGVNTGEVLVGALRAGGDYTAMGDVVNTAQRLQSAAEPGTVLVGPATHTATVSAIEYRSAGLLQAKGRDEPVAAHVAVEPLLPPGYRRRRRASAFIGRDAELGLLVHAAELTAARSRAELVVLTGEAGVGKSRLAEEVAGRARRHLDARVLEGRCVPYGEANVWWPVAEAVRQGLDLPADRSGPEVEEAVRRGVAAALGGPDDDAEIARVTRGLLTLLGHETALRGIDPDNARAEVVRAVQRYLGAVARDGLVVLVLSDLHWADEVVLELIGSTLERLARCRLLLVATARGELLDRWSPPLGRHNVTVVNLDPLDAASAGVLLDALAPEPIDDALAQALLDRSGGNPFFLEELLALVGEDVAPRTRPAEQQTVLPDTLRGLVAARLDGLTPSERAVIDNAAVWGRSGPVLALEKMGKDAGDDLTSAMDALDDRELIVVDGDRWRFRSDLIREVAYATLTKADRARRHAGIAGYLEAGAPLDAAGERVVDERTLEVVAFHYAAAAELAADLGAVPGVPADLVDRALQWVERAAARAWDAKLHPAAARLFTQGVALAGGDDRRRCRLLLGQARALGELRELPAARAAVEEATVLAAATGDEALAARALLALGDLEQKAGQASASATTLRAAAEALAACGEDAAHAEALRLRGLSLLMAGAHDAAEASVRDALGAYRRLGDRRGEAWGLQNLAWIAYLHGSVPEALVRLERAEATFAELGDAVGLSWVKGLLAFVRYHLGQHDVAEDLAEEVLIDARQRSDRWGEGMMLLLLAGVRLWSGRAAMAVTPARDALELFRAAGDRLGEAQATGFLARALVLAGEVGPGVELLTEHLDRVPPPGVAVDEHRRIVAIALAGAAAQLGDVRLGRRALAMVDDEDLAPRDIGDVDVLVGRGINLLLAGLPEAAHEVLLVATDPGDGVRPSPYALAARAVSGAAIGAVDDADLTAAAVLEDERATYADRHLAHLAQVLVAVEREEPPGPALTALERNLAGVSDAVTSAVVDVVTATVLDHVGDPAAADVRRRAQMQLEALGVDGTGWAGVVEGVLRRRVAAPPAGTA
ncbi:MAG: adenylate/guanylate cyclase domain-containing protein [Acidimicrobiales bacterium]